MTIAVENLGKLERRFTITLPKQDIEKEVAEHIQKLLKTVRMRGFRPGKVPLKLVTQQYGSQVEAEVVSNKVSQQFLAVSKEQDLRVAGRPNFAPKVNAAEIEYVFDVTFEVYPDVKIGDLSKVQVSRTMTDVSEADIDRTIDILRKQRVHYHVRGDGSSVKAKDGDRVTVDFEGKIDGEVFAGSSAEDFVFVLGEGRTLTEFEKATLGLKVGESKECELTFPDEYHGKAVAGKTATFVVTLKKIECAHLPEINGKFAKSLGIANGSIEKMRADIKENLLREVKRRTQALLKDQVMNALISVSELDIPTALVAQDQELLVAMARQDLEQRGVPNASNVLIPAETFKEQAERRVKLGLILAELVKQNDLQVKPEQIKAEIEEVAKSYEDPQEVVRWYYNDKQRMAEMEVFVVENNVVEFVLGKAKVITTQVSFEELAGNAQA